MVRHILLDLDNTLYPASCGLNEAIQLRMTEYAARHLGLVKEKAAALRRKNIPIHGSTLAWLQNECGLRDREDFMSFVHPKELADLVPPDPRLKETLNAVPAPLSILTNAPEEHGRNVLRHLGVEDAFVRLFDIRFNEFEGKPHESAYRRVCAALDLAPEDILFVDDMRLYVEGFTRIGGKGLLVDERGAEPVSRDAAEARIPAIRSIHELPAWMEAHP